jgi:hypothetical protein
LFNRRDLVLSDELFHGRNLVPRRILEVLFGGRYLTLQEDLFN